ncbi:hypothetical protein BGX38DRAFT_364678 [Terfezia claveryi]|nr:hypothetical protein BGX38DRAFT_364678 [Terfezia claveryi]
MIKYPLRTTRASCGRPWMLSRTPPIIGQLTALQCATSTHLSHSPPSYLVFYEMMEAAQARLMGKIMRDPEAIGDLVFEDEGTAGRNSEPGGDGIISGNRSL